MPSNAAMFVAIIVTFLIVVAAAIGLLFLTPRTNSNTTTSSSNTTSNPPSYSTTTTNSSSSSSSNGNNCSTGCTLNLVQPRSQPVLTSPMITSMPQAIFPNDGPCCGGQAGDEINYTDNGNLWALQGDIDVGGSPEGAWASANNSGLSITYNTCIYAYISEYETSGYVCGPHHEYLQGEGPYDSSIYGDLGAIPVCPPSTCGNRPLVLTASSYFGSRNVYDSPSITPVPSSATVFSIDVNLPYHNFYSTCQQDTKSNSTDPLAPLNDGCTYESTIGPYDSASLGFDVGGNYDIVGIAEVCPCTSTANSLQMFAYTSNGGASITKILNITTIADFTPFHKLTVATDRRTFVDFYVDNLLVYSSSTMPIQQSTNYGGVIEFTTRTNINHEADIVTFSNAAVYSNSTITATNLPSGAILSVTGPDGFSSNETADPNGKAVVDVSAEPMNLIVSVKSNGETIAKYAQPVNAGAVLNLSNSSSSGVILPSFLQALFVQIADLQATAFIGSLLLAVGISKRKIDNRILTSGRWCQRRLVAL